VQPLQQLVPARIKLSYADAISFNILVTDVAETVSIHDRLACKRYAQPEL